MKTLTWILSGVCGLMVGIMGIVGIMASEQPAGMVYLPAIVLGLVVLFLNFKQFLSIKPDKNVKDYQKKYSK